MKRLILLFFLIPVVFSEYYADVNLFVNTDGYVNVEGINNYPYLKSSNNFTSKDGEIWTLNLNYDDIFSNYIYTLHLPKNTIIKNIYTPSVMSIESNNNEIIIIGVGTNESFKLKLIYSFKKKKQEITIIIILIIIFLIILSFLIYKFKKDKIKIDYSTLTNRQVLIIEELKKRKIITQKELEQLNLMPKSSLSRNIKSLEKKDLIMKNKKGKTNILMLKFHSVPVNSAK